ncbi:MAG: hypothetical protein Q4Q42_00080 [Planctomycetia bacterium]|nr:hypothetical protein [Planctomycetia bacterium]
MKKWLVKTRQGDEIPVQIDLSISLIKKAVVISHKTKNDGSQ